MEEGVLHSGKDLSDLCYVEKDILWYSEKIVGNGADGTEDEEGCP